MAQTPKWIDVTASISPVPVQIVRPHQEKGVQLLTSLFILLLRTLMITWLAPVATQYAWQPGWWQSMAAAIVASNLFSNGSGSYIWWTRGAKDKP